MKNIAKQIVEEKLKQFEVVREFDYGFVVHGFIRKKKDALLATCDFKIYNDMQNRVCVQLSDCLAEQPIYTIRFEKLKSFRELTDGNILFAALLKGFLTA